MIERGEWSAEHLVIGIDIGDFHRLLLNIVVSLGQLVQRLTAQVCPTLYLLECVEPSAQVGSLAPSIHQWSELLLDVYRIAVEHSRLFNDRFLLLVGSILHLLGSHRAVALIQLQQTLVVLALGILGGSVGALLA